MSSYYVIAAMLEGKNNKFSPLCSCKIVSSFQPSNMATLKTSIADISKSIHLSIISSFCRIKSSLAFRSESHFSLSSELILDGLCDLEHRTGGEAKSSPDMFAGLRCDRDTGTVEEYMGAINKWPTKKLCDQTYSNLHKWQVLLYNLVLMRRHSYHT